MCVGGEALPDNNKDLVSEMKTASIIRNHYCIFCLHGGAVSLSFFFLFLVTEHSIPSGMVFMLCPHFLFIAFLETQANVDMPSNVFTNIAYLLGPCSLFTRSCKYRVCVSCYSM